MLSQLEGIVIRTRPYGETNKIVTLFTREAGKITCMARGAKKPASRLASVTQPFTHGTYSVYKGKGMGTLQNGDRLESFRHMREDILATAYVSYITELIDRLTEQDEPQPIIYEILYQALRAIEEEYDPEAIALFVEWKMLPVAGLTPTLHQCANCGETEGEFAFSFQELGFLCHRCFHVDPYIIRLSPALIKVIRMLYSVPIERVGSLTLKKESKQLLKTIIRTVYEEQAGIRLKSRQFLEQLERTPEFLPVKKAAVKEAPVKEELPKEEPIEEIAIEETPTNENPPEDK
ncbi:DNA repair protein RecO [Planococcus lenghuensis]|uniref:DNA repair protein RecO n=1 Tax=Planococcus lenghuensis TaxID=2213202 RepID=A0A1Q2KXP4_9BACL|nr:DNA repair protein RecO [Planococcus lenghuensis]AQQ52971.1 DNA repair protein RecO [Planococcus lenghuensis]